MEHRIEWIGEVESNAHDYKPGYLNQHLYPTDPSASTYSVLLGQSEQLNGFQLEQCRRKMKKPSGFRKPGRF
jgi:hypothetical protein